MNLFITCWVLENNQQNNKKKTLKKQKKRKRMRKKEKPKCYQLYLAYYLFSCHTLYAWCSYSSQYRVNTHVYVVSTSRLSTIFNVIFYIHSLCVFAQWEFDFKWKFTQIIYKLYTNTHTYTHIYTHIHIHTYIYISECSAICCYSELSHVLHFENKNQKPKSNKKTKIGKKGKGKNKDEIYIEIAFFIFSLSLKGSTYCIYIYQIYIYMK